MNFRLCFFVLCFHLTCLCTHSVFASVIRIDTQSGQAGETVRFTVSAENAANAVHAMGFEIAYDATILQYRGFSPGSLTQNFTHFSANNTGFGVVRVGGFDGGEHVISEGASGNLLTLNFEVVGENGCSLQVLNLLDDIKAWHQENGFFDRVMAEAKNADDIDDEKGEDSVQADTLENEKAENKNESVNNTASDFYTAIVESRSAPDSIGSTSLLDSESDSRRQMEDIGKNTTKTVIDKNNNRVTSEKSVNSRLAESDGKAKTVIDKSVLLPPVINKNKGHQDNKMGLSSIKKPKSMSVPEKIDIDEISENGTSETYVLIRLIAVILLIVLAVQFCIFWQTRTLTKLMKRR